MADVSNRFAHPPPRPRAKVHLGLFAGFDFHSPHPLRRGLSETANEAFDRLVGTTESNLADQILIDPLGAQPAFQPLGDVLAVDLALPGPTRAANPSGRLLRDDLGSPFRAGGRNGGF